MDADTAMTGEVSAPEIGANGAACLPAGTPEALIAETLEWCLEHFGATRARFVRPTESGWTVYTLRPGAALMTHEADYGEVAMARTVGLGRRPLSVTKPRVSRPGTTDLRPIAVTSYLGVPLVCQDQLVGVIECAGGTRPDIDAALQTALPRLEFTGTRLLHDPALSEPPGIAPETRCTLGGGFWPQDSMTITGQELAFLHAFAGPTSIADAAAAAGLDTEVAVEMATGLVRRGLLEPHED